MKWCRSCVLPDTRPGLTIDDQGVCRACRTHAERPKINWEKRERALDDTIAAAKGRSQSYDCIIPVSGGKDSTWQVVECLGRGLHPLCVTWKTPARTEI